MFPVDHPRASVARLLTSWLAFTRWTLSIWLAFTRWTYSSCVGTAPGWAERAADRVKDTLLDLGCSRSTGEDPVALEAGPLPALDVAAFVAGLRERVERTLEKTADAINEEPCAAWAPVTQERVVALFRDLAQEVLAEALEMRVSAAEALLGGTSASPEEWVKRYRRMKAAEGQWPPASVEESRQEE